MSFTRWAIVLAATALAWLAYAMASAEADASPTLGIEIARVAAYGLTAIVAVRGANFLVTELLLEQHWEIAATSLIRLVVNLLFGGVAIALLLRLAFGIDVTTVLTTSAVITFIVGLALQPTLASLFAGLAIQIEHQLRVGDIIRLDKDDLAVVEAMRWRSIAARRPDGSLAIVPNSQIVSRQIDIQRPNELTTVEIMVPGPLSLPPMIVEEIIEDAMLDVPGLSADPPATVSLASLNASNHIGEFRVRFFASGASLLDQQRYAILLRTRLWYVYQRHGITILGAPRGRGGVDTSDASEGDGPRETLRRAFAASRRWHQANAAEQHGIAEAGVTLLYAAQEALRLPQGWDRATALLVNGRVTWNGGAGNHGIVIEPPVVELDADTSAPDWDPEMLADIKERLSEAIGPYAHRAVAGAAQAAPNSAALHYQLAQLIEYGSARDAFMRDAPPERGREFGIGTVFLLHRVNRGLSVPLVAQRQIELLALRSEG